MLISLTYLTVLSVACNTIQSVNFRRCTSLLKLTILSSLYWQCRHSTKVSWFLQLSPAVNNALLHGLMATKTHPYLLQTVPTFSTTCRSTKLTKNLFTAAARDSLLLCKMQLSKLTEGRGRSHWWWLFCILRLCWHWSITSGIRRHMLNGNKPCVNDDMSFLW